MDEEIEHVARNRRMGNAYPCSRKTWSEEAAYDVENVHGSGTTVLSCALETWAPGCEDTS